MWKLSVVVETQASASAGAKRCHRYEPSDKGAQRMELNMVHKRGERMSTELEGM